MCSGRVEPEFALQAFRKGADGVLIAGCHLGDCRYGEGNLKVFIRFHILKKIVEDFGIEKERIQLIWVSASDANILADKINNMTAYLKALGPLRWNS
jgi:coenzyme F420-reducing hydrogenase delta subunit